MPQTQANFDLGFLERHVNDRRRSEGRADLPADLLPESARPRPMLWAAVPAEAVDVARASSAAPSRSALGIDLANGQALFPIHPLLAARYGADYSVIEAGTMELSSSYRTVFYSPDSSDPLGGIADGRRAIMLKLHLDEPLPGISGDRRLTPSKVSKCLKTGAALAGLSRQGVLATELEIIEEPVAILHGERGALLRFVPNRKVIPVFSLSSHASDQPDEKTLIERALYARFASDGDAAAEAFGECFARQFVEALFSAFVQGFALEMHAQNTLVELDHVEAQIRRVYFRDMEGVVFSDGWRQHRGLPLLFSDDPNPEIHALGAHFGRYFNRHLDHDLGRIWLNMLETLQADRYFSERQVKTAIRSIQRTVRSAANQYDLARLFLPGRWLRVSRSPYGSGYRPGDYYACRFR